MRFWILSSAGADLRWFLVGSFHFMCSHLLSGFITAVVSWSWNPVGSLDRFLRTKNNVYFELLCSWAQIALMVPDVWWGFRPEGLRQAGQSLCDPCCVVPRPSIFALLLLDDLCTLSVECWCIFRERSRIIQTALGLFFVFVFFWGFFLGGGIFAVKQ